MTQKELAERVGISRQTLNAIENARRPPTIDVAIRIADVFGILVDQLFDLDYEGKPARRDKAPAIAARRPTVTARESDRVANEDVPATREAKKEITFADLQKVIDS